MTRRVPTRSGALQVGDRTTTRLDQLVGFGPEHDVPRARGRPHLVEPQQIGIDENAQLRAVTKRWHATPGFGNPSD